MLKCRMKMFRPPPTWERPTPMPRATTCRQRAQAVMHYLACLLTSAGAAGSSLQPSLWDHWGAYSVDYLNATNYKHQSFIGYTPC